MSQLVIVFVLLCALQQSASGAPSHGLRTKTNAIVGNSGPTHSHIDPAHALAKIRKKLRSLANRRDSNPQFEAFSKRLDELSQKNIIPHAATAPLHDFNIKKKTRSMPKIRNHHGKFLQSRSGIVGDSVTPQPLVYDPYVGDSAKDLDGYKKGAGAIVQPKSLY